MEELFPVGQDLPEIQRKNNLRMLEDLKARYWEAPDLAHVGKNGYRFPYATASAILYALSMMGFPSTVRRNRFSS